MQSEFILNGSVLKQRVTGVVCSEAQKGAQLLPALHKVVITHKNIRIKKMKDQHDIKKDKINQHSQTVIINIQNKATNIIKTWENHSSLSYQFVSS